jgi:hypothetical protein
MKGISGKEFGDGDVGGGSFPFSRPALPFSKDGFLFDSFLIIDKIEENPPKKSSRAIQMNPLAISSFFSRKNVAV